MLEQKTRQEPNLYRPTALRIYLRLVRHIDYVQRYPCNYCYARGTSLIIQGDAEAHIQEIAGRDFDHIHFETVVRDLEHFGLIIHSNIRMGLHELALLYSMRGMRHG
jgi:hypothetical protein